MLLAALLAAVCAAPVAQADTPVRVTPDGQITDSFVSDTVKPATTPLLTKDGANTVVVTGDVTKYASLYVREGTLKVGDGSTATNLTVYPKDIWTGTWNIAGKDAKVVLDKATVVNKGEGYRYVGGLDGNGSLELTNGSQMVGDCNVFAIGVSNMTTTASPYYTGVDGNKTPAKNGSGVEFGRGDVTVSGGSHLEATFHSFYMGEGSLNVEGTENAKSSVVIGKQDGSGYYAGFRILLGMGENTTSEINVGANASVNLSAQEEFSTNMSANSTTNITVSGENADFTVTDVEDQFSKVYIGGKKNAGALYGQAVENATTSIVVNGGGSVNFNCQGVVVGAEGADEKNAHVTIDIQDAASSLNIKGKDASFNKGVELVNKGTVSIELLDSQNPVGQTLNVAGAEIQNEGTMDVTYDMTVKEDATVTNDGSISARSISLYDKAQVTNNETATISTTGDVIVAGDSSLSNSGTIQADYFQVMGNASVENSGTVEGITWLQGQATLTLAEGSELDYVFVSGTSTLNIEGAVTLNGNLAQYNAQDGAQIVFEEGASLDMQGNNITLGNIQLVFEVDGTVSSTGDISVNMFIRNWGNESDYEDTVVLVKGSDGSFAEVKYGDLNIVPEPTTATLSLLALVGLCARRRRK